MLISILVIKAIVLREIAQHKIEADAEVRTAPMQGGRTHGRPILMRQRVATWPAGS